MVSCKVHRCPFTKEQWDARLAEKPTMAEVAKEVTELLKEAKESGEQIFLTQQVAAASLSHKEE